VDAGADVTWLRREEIPAPAGNRISLIERDAQVSL